MSGQPEAAEGAAGAGTDGIAESVAAPAAGASGPAGALAVPAEVPGGEAAGVPVVAEEHLRIAEALIFASDRPVAPTRLGTLLPDAVEPHAVLAALRERYEGRGVVLVEVAGGFAFRTAADLAPRLTRVIEAPRRLPRAAMEALSIIAYHQPCTRAEIEEIRGATLAQSTVESLLEMGLVAPRGRRETPGRPTLWGTTPRFLEQFGLTSLADLPRREELVSVETLPQLPLQPPAPAPAPAAAAPEAAGAPQTDAAAPP